MCSSPEEREVRQKDRQKKEQEAIEYAQKKRGLEDAEHISKNKLKKIKRNPTTVFREKKGRDHYEKCENGCGNIRVRHFQWKICCVDKEKLLALF